MATKAPVTTYPQLLKQQQQKQASKQPAQKWSTKQDNVVSPKRQQHQKQLAHNTSIPSRSKSPVSTLVPPPSPASIASSPSSPTLPPPPPRSKSPVSTMASCSTSIISATPLPSPLQQRGINYGLHNVLSGHKKAISSVNFSSDGYMLASSSADRTVRLWDVATGKYIKSLVGHRLGISDVAWSPHSSLMATASDDTCVNIWDSTNANRVNTLKGHTNYVMCVSFHPHANLVASGSFDTTVRIWDLDMGGSCLHRIDAHDEMVVSANFDSEGSMLVTAGFDGYVKVWDVNSGSLINSFPGSHRDPNIPVCFAKFSPNNKYILVGSFDGTWKLLETDTGKRIRVYEGHKFNDYCIFASFSLTGGKWIISGSADNNVYIWDINSRQLLHRLSGHEDVVVAVSAHPTQDVIASGALENDKTVRLWKPQVLEENNQNSSSQSTSAEQSEEEAEEEDEN